MSESNGATSFALEGTVGGFTDVSIATVSKSQGGALAQSNNSIRFNAPLQFQSQNTAVTVKDYETLTKRFYPNALSISAYGGEDAETPVYGKVFIGIVPQSGATLTETSKLNIVNNLKKYNLASVTPEIVTPETTSILVTSNIKFDENRQGLANLLTIYSVVSGKNITEIELEYDGKMYSEFKNNLGVLWVEYLSPIQKEYNLLIKDKGQLEKILKDGSEKAQHKDYKTLDKVYRKIGLVKKIR